MRVKNFLGVGLRFFSTVKSRIKKRNHLYKYQVAVVAIIKNEGEYITEWVKYHKLIGVNKFYLYNNGSTDDTAEKLKPFIESGLVELIDYPGIAKQLPAYNNALKVFGDKCKYMAFIDADEFIFLLNRDDKLVDVLDKIIELDEKAGGIAINWTMFGSSGHIKKPTGGVLENYLYRVKDGGRGNGCIKTVVMPKFVYAYEHVHYPTYIYGKYSIDENGNRVRGWLNNVEKTYKIRINHYFTKSKEEWIQRRSLGKADSKQKEKTKRTIEEFYQYDNNDIYDDSMLFYANKIKNI